ncbi:hypothetical protein NQ314_011664 [Rhamnusium bicolor]|uniref:Uncharacterized protein n=1 Tax=Rhamnusium bicolor TaxID=1586634 RepID=A0AAV8XH05_9CUCU|nr:hypothetical protein NQ314_011664 [Rhamnusium bicolor]
MRALVPELLSNLGHPAPALRKGALDTLRNYLRHSRNYDELLKELITNTTVEDNVIAAAPFLISSSTTNKTLSYVIDQLWKEIHNKNYHQEISAKSLARIRYSLGDERFKMLIGAERFNDLQKVCDSYGLPIDYSDGDISDIENAMWEEEETIEDKVILETEITLRTGPAITMKIHEETDDSESDYYEAARRTPRKVRFGGEQVKMRTPESDSSNHDESLSTIRITVTDAVSIKTRRSLIPVRITSLPSTPRKALPSSLVKPRLHKSTPNLSRSSSISRIPLKKGTNIKISAVPDTEAPKG